MNISLAALPNKQEDDHEEGNDWNATKDKKVKKKINLRKNRKVTEKFSQEECKRKCFILSDVMYQSVVTIYSSPRRSLVSLWCPLSYTIHTVVKIKMEH